MAECAEQGAWCGFLTNIHSRHKEALYGGIPRGMRIYHRHRWQFLMTLLSTSQACKDLGEPKGFKLDVLADMANKMLEEIETNGLGVDDVPNFTSDYGFPLSFMIYPQAEAYA